MQHKHTRAHMGWREEEEIYMYIHMCTLTHEYVCPPPSPPGCVKAPQWEQLEEMTVKCSPPRLTASSGHIPTPGLTVHCAKSYLGLLESSQRICVEAPSPIVASPHLADAHGGGGGSTEYCTWIQEIRSCCWGVSVLSLYREGVGRRVGDLTIVSTGVKASSGISGVLGTPRLPDSSDRFPQCKHSQHGQF